MSGEVTAVAPVYGAALCAGAAVVLAGGRRPAVRRARALFGAPGSAARTGPLGRVAGAVRTRGARREWWCVPAGAAVGLLGASWLPLLAGAAAVPLVRRRLRGRERRAAEDRRAAAVIELCAAVSGGLRAGRQPAEALLAAAPGGPAGGPEVLAAARFGGDVPAALRGAAGEAGAQGLAGVAACWQAAAGGGAGLADGLDRVAAALRAERDERDELRAQLAGPRATALLLALLPVFGLLMGTALGASPLRVLLHTPAGLLCLAAGCLLEWAGLAWTGRIVRGAHAR
ncbi:type II secretion system F family protein [Streptomyces sp. MAR4 CNX-425]|uniref:type II secretion system F family protein n=1 Tax=Streptomyces sp. MAR4 CNX-425 TaxID=3406343 RepID=UPI003B500473